MDIYATTIRFFQEGGAFMYPIAIVLAFGAAIAIERFVYLGAVRRANRRVWNDLSPLLTRRDFAGALAYTRDSDATMSRIFTYGLERSQSSGRRDDVETAMEEGLIEVLPRLEKRTHYLGIFANVATLLGLLGTIIGLIQAFTAVASANPAEKADMLSASISVAMNTTAFGLMVAIPLLLLHALLQTKTTELIDGLEMASVKFLNLIGDTARARSRRRMKLRRWRRHRQQPGELDITAFMNLMVILVPFLLVTAVFSRVAVIELGLPSSGELAAGEVPMRLEITVREDGIEVADRGGEPLLIRGAARSTTTARFPECSRRSRRSTRI